MNVILDRLAGCFGRGCEKRTDIDVKAQVGECRSNDFLAPVVPVLPNLGNEQTRAVLLPVAGRLPKRELSVCLSLALTYHLGRRGTKAKSAQL